jgi:predicted DNA-binding transcriptional regulator AlpA
VVRQTRRSGPPDHRDLSAGDHPEQLALTFDPPKEATPRPPPTEKATAGMAIQRFASLDQRMNTTDVLRVVGVNRSTIFRWVKRGIFPQRHASGGWLRSDVEHWLSEKMGASR